MSVGPVRTYFASIPGFELHSSRQPVAAHRGSIRFEDPRLPLMMAAPTRPDTFMTIDPVPGMLLLWESWLRHEVLAGSGKGERLSISFNLA